jgi:hypothetical protein
MHGSGMIEEIYTGAIPIIYLFGSYRIKLVIVFLPNTQSGADSMNGTSPSIVQDAAF